MKNILNPSNIAMAFITIVAVTALVLFVINVLSGNLHNTSL